MNRRAAIAALALVGGALAVTSSASPAGAHTCGTHTDHYHSSAFADFQYHYNANPGHWHVWRFQYPGGSSSNQSYSC